MSHDTALNNSPAVAAQAVSWKEGKVVLLDQTALPKHENYLICSTTEELIEAIRKLAVRGAPAIGIAGAYGVVLAAQEVKKLPREKQSGAFDKKLKDLELARPTAVNLTWAIGKLKKLMDLEKTPLTDERVHQLLCEARNIHEEDIRSNHQIAEFGAQLLEEGPILTVCNTGDLATGGVGTAFGIFAKAYRQNKIPRVYVCETRPILQGIRLTAWELNRQKIPFTVICDNMAASLMQNEKISAVITGADRIAANGDVANKIGTYSLSLLAKAHSVPFYVAAPQSTFDLSLESGKSIPIEHRNHEEVLSVLGDNRPDYSISVWNPAFDVTPHSLISAIICERGVINYPNQEKIKSVLTGINL
jgi:methylthioribose-1-phosphate isomerase